MRVTTTLATIVLATLAGGALATPAEATGPWAAGGGFNIGGVQFSFGYHNSPRHRHDRGYQPVYYYRTSPRFGMRGVRCASACYLDRGYAYHHHTCPVIAAHFGRHGYQPYGHGSGWSPYVYRHRPYWDHGRDRYRDHHHRGHRGRGRGHEHHRGCRH